MSHAKTNSERAERALFGVEQYATQFGGCESLKESVTDLLTDLRHLCDRESLDFEEMLEASKMHHADELSE